MKKLLILLVLIVCVSNLNAQRFSIQGTLHDSLISKPIPFASVSLLQSDSILVSTQRSSLKGKFLFKGIDSGGYIIIIAHPKYATHTRKLFANKDQDLKRVPLFQKKQLLKTVVIKDRKMITIKGDTISFLADSFKTKTGAVVEDLLKILPGIEVDENGNIKSQGKEVKKVLVNGEEFFGDDPTIATQNLPSKAVEKVEVYDYKDEQESFTGFSGDANTKVVNLKLKKEMNRGGFVKLGSHSNIFGDRWDQKAMINNFQDKEQIGVYYLSNSNKMARMDWEESQTFGGGNSFINEDGAMVTTMTTTGDGSGNPFRGGAQYGLNKSWKTGGRYANKFEKRNQELNINYSFLRSTRERELKQYTEQLLPGLTINKVDSTQSNFISNGHSLNTKYKVDLDSNLSLTYNLRLQLRNSQFENREGTKNTNFDEAPISFNNRTSSTESRMSNFSNSINLKKKFNKKGRTLSYQLSHSFRKSKSDNYIQSTNTFDLLNGGQTIDLDQKRLGNKTNTDINSNIVYTEPLSDHLKLKLSYRYAQRNNENENITLDTIGSIGGNYLRQLDSLSTIFDSKQKTHQPGFVLRYEKDKLRVSLSNDISFASFVQTDLLRSNNFDYNQTNYIPGLSVRYKITKYRSVSARYSGRTRTPSASQLQPFPDNRNPLSVIIGNPNLKMAYAQRVNLNYSSYAPIEGHSSYISLSGRNTINQIGQARSFDEAGRTTTTYINLPNSYGANFYAYHSHKIGTTNFRVGFNSNGNFSYSPNRVNDVSGHNENATISISPSLRFYDKDLMSFRVNLETRFTQNKNSGNVDRTVRYFSYSPNVGVDFHFPRFISLGTEATFDYTPAVAPYNTPFQRLLSSANVSKKLLNDRSLVIEFKLFDAFNQNKGYNRRNDVNFNTESFYNTLGRYWMVGATWSLLYGPANAKNKKKEKGTSGSGWRKNKKDKKEEGNKKAPSGGGTTIIINN